MGLVLWIASGLAGFLIARIVPFLRPAQIGLELFLALVTALVAGVVATALDFGGWGVLEPRAAFFAFFTAFTALGAARLAQKRG